MWSLKNYKSSFYCGVLYLLPVDFLGLGLSLLIKWYDFRQKRSSGPLSLTQSLIRVVLDTLSIRDYLLVSFLNWLDVPTELMLYLQPTSRTSFLVNLAYESKKHPYMNLARLLYCQKYYSADTSLRKYIVEKRISQLNLYDRLVSASFREARPYLDTQILAHTLSFEVTNSVLSNFLSVYFLSHEFLFFYLLGFLVATYSLLQNLKSDSDALMETDKSDFKPQNLGNRSSLDRLKDYWLDLKVLIWPGLLPLVFSFLLYDSARNLIFITAAGISGYSTVDQVLATSALVFLLCCCYRPLIAFHRWVWNRLKALLKDSKDFLKKHPDFIAFLITWTIFIRSYHLIMLSLKLLLITGLKLIEILGVTIGLPYTLSLVTERLIKLLFLSDLYLFTFLNGYTSLVAFSLLFQNIDHFLKNRPMASKATDSPVTLRESLFNSKDFLRVGLMLVLLLFNNCILQYNFNQKLDWILESMNYRVIDSSCPSLFCFQDLVHMIFDTWFLQKTSYSFKRIPQQMIRNTPQLFTAVKSYYYKSELSETFFCVVDSVVYFDLAWFVYLNLWILVLGIFLRTLTRVWVKGVAYGTVYLMFPEVRTTQIPDSKDQLDVPKKVVPSVELTNRILDLTMLLLSSCVVSQALPGRFLTNKKLIRLAQVAATSFLFYCSYRLAGLLTTTKTQESKDLGEVFQEPEMSLPPKN